MNLPTAAVLRLQAEGWPEPIYAWRRWDGPEQGSAVIVLTEADTWTAGRTSAAYPTLRVLVTAAPTGQQDDAEAIAVEVAERVRTVLHRPQGGAATWGALRVLSSLLAGAGGPGGVEGHESWVVISQTYEVQTG